jgi:hypothetical protein
MASKILPGGAEAGHQEDYRTGANMSEPHWATQKNAWGESRGRYSFRGRRDGWSCHHCGGLFRGLPKLLAHQEKVMSERWWNYGDYTGDDCAWCKRNRMLACTDATGKTRVICEKCYWEPDVNNFCPDIEI